MRVFTASQKVPGEVYRCHPDNIRVTNISLICSVDFMRRHYEALELEEDERGANRTTASRWPAPDPTVILTPVPTISLADLAISPSTRTAPTEMSAQASLRDGARCSPTRAAIRPMRLYFVRGRVGAVMARPPHSQRRRPRCGSRLLRPLCLCNQNKRTIPYDQ